MRNDVDAAPGVTARLRRTRHAGADVDGVAVARPDDPADSPTSWPTSMARSTAASSRPTRRSTASCYDSRVTYIGVGRDPRDAAVSMLFQETNIDQDRMRALHQAAAPPHDGFGPPPPPPHGELNVHRRSGAGWSGRSCPRKECRHWPHCCTTSTPFWQRRHLPNVAVFHFVDYQADLAGELIRLGRVLGYDVSRDRAEELVKHASLDVMRARASQLAPNSTDGIWRSDEALLPRRRAR